MKRAVLFVLIAGACSSNGGGEDDASSTPRDTGERYDAGDIGVAEVHVGTGFERFEPVTPGEMIPLIEGPQGGGRYFGFHIWFGARLVGYPFGVARVSAEILDAESGERRGFQERNTALMPDGDDRVVFGIAPRIADCCEVQHKELIMRVEVESPDAPFGESEVRVRTSTCGEPPLCE